jgi:3-phosphoshikimate 1-carboxyvinyltransferase
VRISPAKLVRGRAAVPGDKSISHRAAMLAAVAEGGASRVSNFATSADCASTLSCLAQLGVELRREGSAVRIRGGSDLRAPDAPLDCGNSGTTMRLLAGLLAGRDFISTLTGDRSLRSRPMRRIIEPIDLMGGRVESREGRAPLTVHGRDELRAITYAPPVASAQVKSCVLLGGLRAAGTTSVIERFGPTRDHTERLLRWFGVEVLTQRTTSSRPVGGSVPPGGAADAATGDGVGWPTAPDAQIVSIEGGGRLRARDVIVPGDISSAAFLLVAAAMLEGSDLTLEGVSLNPTRARVLEVLRALGADVSAADAREESNEPAGDIRVRGAGILAPSRAGANRISGALSAALIDELPVLAVAGTRVEGGVEIRDAAELRVKESDRITATVLNLRAMGAEVEEHEGGLTVAGPVRLRGALVRSYGDHRVAMAAAVAALAAEGDTEIEGADCVSVSFPEFFPLLESIAVR